MGETPLQGRARPGIFVRAGPAIERVDVLVELFRTNDPALLSFVTALLSGEDIEAVVFDVHTSVLEGSIGILPRRVMVLAEDAAAAREVLELNGLELSPGP